MIMIPSFLQRETQTKSKKWKIEVSNTCFISSIRNRMFFFYVGKIFFPEEIDLAWRMNDVIQRVE